MKLGVLIPEAVRPFSTQQVLGALDVWAERSAMPALFGLWVVRQGPNTWHLDPLLAAAIRERGAEPVLFLESTGASYPDILVGKYDMELRYLGCRIARIGGPVIVRWDQEPNGTGLGADWQTPANKALYVDVFRYVSDILRGECDAQMFYCPVGRQNEDVAQFAQYYPGPEAAQVVGFTMFSRTEEGRFPVQQMADSVAALKQIAPDSLVMVGETGRENGLTRRSAWLRELNTVPGVWGALVFDMLVGNGDDWRWSNAMYRTFADLT